MLVELSPVRRVVSITITNPGDRPLMFQTQVRRWRQPDGADVYTDSTQLFVVPPIAEIAAGGAQEIDLAVKAARKAGTIAIDGSLGSSEVNTSRFSFEGQVATLTTPAMLSARYTNPQAVRPTMNWCTRRAASAALQPVAAAHEHRPLGPGGPAGHRTASAARPEQRPGCVGHGPDSHVLSRLSTG